MIGRSCRTGKKSSVAMATWSDSESELDMDEEIAIHGGCLCQAITYTILPPSEDDTRNGRSRIRFKRWPHGRNHCHCDTCRNISGALFQTLAQVPTKRINIVDGKGSLTTYRVSPNAEREHCAICGTTMWIKDTGWENLDKGYINVSVGSMNKEDAKKVGIFASSYIFGGYY